MQPVRLDLERHSFMLTSNNRVLGHFSNRDLAAFTGAQRTGPSKPMFINGERVRKDELETMIQIYGNEVRE